MRSPLVCLLLALLAASLGAHADWGGRGRGAWAERRSGGDGDGDGDGDAWGRRRGEDWGRERDGYLPLWIIDILRRLGLYPPVVAPPGSPPPPPSPKPTVTPTPKPTPRPTPKPTTTPEPKPTTTPPPKPTTTPAPTPTITPAPTPKPTVPPPPPTTAPPGFQATILNYHNSFRAKHHAPALTWSAMLASAAASWAARCQFAHSNQGYGENLCQGHPDWTACMTAWANEINSYDFANPGFSSATGHATQMLWVATTRIGCAAQACAEGPLYVCEYDPPGNVIGQFQQNVLPE